MLFFCGHITWDHRVTITRFSSEILKGMILRKIEQHHPMPWRWIKYCFHILLASINPQTRIIHIDSRTWEMPSELIWTIFPLQSFMESYSVDYDSRRNKPQPGVLGHSDSDKRNPQPRGKYQPRPTKVWIDSMDYIWYSTYCVLLIEVEPTSADLRDYLVYYCAKYVIHHKTETSKTLRRQGFFGRVIHLLLSSCWNAQSENPRVFWGSK